MTPLAGVRLGRGEPVVLAACPLPDVASGTWVVVEDPRYSTMALRTAEVACGPAEVLDGHHCQATLRVVRRAGPADLRDDSAAAACLAAAQAVWHEENVAPAPRGCAVSADGAAATLWVEGELPPEVTARLATQVSRHTGRAVQVHRESETRETVPWLAVAPGVEVAALREAAAEVLALLENGHGHGLRGFSGDLPAPGQRIALQGGEEGTVEGIAYRGPRRGEPVLRVRLASGEEVQAQLVAAATGWVAVTVDVTGQGERGRHGTARSRKRTT